MNDVYVLISKIDDINMSAALKAIIDDLLICPLKKIDFAQGAAIGALFMVMAGEKIDKSDYEQLRKCIIEISRNRIKHRI